MPPHSRQQRERGEVCKRKKEERFLEFPEITRFSRTMKAIAKLTSALFDGHMIQM